MESIQKFEPLFGEWHAESLIGSGGSGSVYRAWRQSGAGREYCAVKYFSVPEEERIAALRAQGIDEQSLAAICSERLMDINREQAIAERLKACPHVLGYEETETRDKPGGAGYDVFIRMRLLPTLAERIKQGSISNEEAERLANDIASAIAECSSQGIVHRDIKPENVFMASDGRYLLGDLGNARLLGGDTGFTRGSDNECYLAPEVFKGEKPCEATDIYALGMVLYRALNKGRAPFVNSQNPSPAEKEKAEFRRIAGAPLPKPEDANEKLSALISRACAADPKERFGYAGELVRALAGRAEALPVSELEPFEEGVSEVRESFEAAPTAPVIPAEAAAKPKKEKKAKKEKQPKPAKAPKEPKPRPTREEIPEPEDDEEYAGSGKGLKAAIIVVSVITVLALLGIIGMLAKKVIDRINEIPDKPAEINRHAPEIVQDPNDKDLFHVTVFERRGTALVYEQIDGRRKEYAVPEDNKFTFDIRGETLLPDEPIESTAYSVQPKIYVRNSEGLLTPVADMGYIMIDVPQLKITLDQEEEIFTDEGGVTVSGTIDHSDALLTVNGELMEIGSEGRFVYNTSYDVNGVYEIPIEARLPKYAVYHGAVKVTVELPEPPTIRLPWDLEEQNYSQRVTDPGEVVEVHGMIPEGAALTAQFEPEPDPEAAVDPETGVVQALSDITLEEDGHFSFTATLPKIGDYVIKLTCTDAEGLVSERLMHVQRAPEYKSYVQKAWAMNYDSLTRPGKQVYNIKGVVTEIIQHGDYYLAAIDTGDGNTLLLEYHNHYPSANTLTVGKTYSWIYGYPLGRNDEGAPVVYVWFIADR